MVMPGLGNLGKGALQGLQVSRKLDAQEKQQQRAERQMEMQEESHGLNMEQTQNQMEHREKMRPKERTRADLGIEQTRTQMDRQDKLFPFQLDAAKLESQKAQLGLNEKELEVQGKRMQRDFKQRLPGAKASIQQGDLEAPAAYLAEKMPNQFGELIDADENGATFAIEGDDGNTQELTVEADDLLRTYQSFAGVEQQDPQYSKAGDGLMFNERTGEFVQHEGGQGGGLDFGPGGGSGGGSGDIDTSDLNLVERIGKRYHGQFNPDNQFMGFKDDKTRNAYMEGNSRSEQLISLGMNPMQAAEVGHLSVRQQKSEEELRKQALEKAKEENPDTWTSWSDGHTEEQVQEIYEQMKQESNAAQRQYETIMERARQQQQGQQIRQQRQNNPDYGGGAMGAVPTAPTRQGGQQGGVSQGGEQAGGGQPDAPDSPDAMFEAGSTPSIYGRAKNVVTEGMEGMADPDTNLIAQGWREIGAGMEKGFDNITFTRRGAGGNPEVVGTGKQINDAVNQGLNRFSQDVAKPLARGTYQNLKGQAVTIKDFILGSEREVPNEVKPFLQKAANDQPPSRSEVLAAMKHAEQNPDQWKREGIEEIKRWGSRYAQQRGNR